MPDTEFSGKKSIDFQRLATKKWHKIRKKPKYGGKSRSTGRKYGEKSRSPSLKAEVRRKGRSAAKKAEVKRNRGVCRKNGRPKSSRPKYGVEVRFRPKFGFGRSPVSAEVQRTQQNLTASHFQSDSFLFYFFWFFTDFFCTGHILVVWKINFGDIDFGDNKNQYFSWHFAFFLWENSEKF